MPHRLPTAAARIVISAAGLMALLLPAPERLWALTPDTLTDAAGLDRVFLRMYNVDFRGAQVLLNERAEADPTDPLTYSVRAVAYTFAELQRLEILETEFFVDDKKITSDKALQPDAEVHQRILSAVDEARRRATTRLQSSPNDRDALFALYMSADVIANYTALIERRQLRGLLMEREVQSYATRLIALSPPAYDAYHAMGVLEYVNSRLPFFVKWFVRFNQIEGSETKAIEYLQIVSDRGRYYGPFARVLLAILHLRAKQPAQARTLLADLQRQFPENPLFPKELDRVNLLMRAQR